jgi:hypothetical protein
LHVTTCVEVTDLHFAHDCSSGVYSPQVLAYVRHFSSALMFSSMHMDGCCATCILNARQTRSTRNPPSCREWAQFLQDFIWFP